MNRVTRCRVCNAPRQSLMEVLAYGNMPLVGGPGGPHAPCYPLTLGMCTTCAAVQVLETFTNEEIFHPEYRYTSTQAGMRPHFEQLADEIATRRLGGGYVLDIGCNDGVLLDALIARNIRCIGVEPVERLARLAGMQHPVVQDFFGVPAAERILQKYGRPAFIVASNVFAHSADVRGMIQGVALLGAPAIIEVHSLLELIRGNQFDTVYHEHQLYYSMGVFDQLCALAGLRVVDIETLPMHGGLMRLHIARTQAAAGARVHAQSAAESAEQLAAPPALTNWAARAHRQRAAICRALRENHIEVAYGAASRGAALLNWCRPYALDLRYVVDGAPSRQGHCIPGLDLPIVPPTVFREANPERALLLAWSHKNAIFEAEKEWRAKGGKFLVPLPTIEVC